MALGGGLRLSTTSKITMKWRSDMWTTEDTRELKSTHSGKSGQELRFSSLDWEKKRTFITECNGLIGVGVSAV